METCSHGNLCSTFQLEALADHPDCTKDIRIARIPCRSRIYGVFHLLGRPSTTITSNSLARQPADPGRLVGSIFCDPDSSRGRRLPQGGERGGAGQASYVGVPSPVPTSAGLAHLEPISLKAGNIPGQDC